MKMMIENIKKQMTIFVLLDALLLLFSFFKGFYWIVNSQIAFLSTLSIVLLSFLAYVRKINKQIALLNENIDVAKDYIDELEDPYDLYDEDKKDKKSSKLKMSMKNLSQTAGSALSFLRLLGYIFLIAGFFALIKTKMFLVMPYILGISIVPLGTVLSGILAAYKRKL